VPIGPPSRQVDVRDEPTNQFSRSLSRQEGRQPEPRHVYLDMSEQNCSLKDNPRAPPLRRSGGQHLYLQSPIVLEARTPHVESKQAETLVESFPKTMLRWGSSSRCIYAPGKVSMSKYLPLTTRNPGMLLAGPALARSALEVATVKAASGPQRLGGRPVQSSPDGTTSIPDIRE
jgi:hypothetical protein